MAGLLAIAALAVFVLAQLPSRHPGPGSDAAAIAGIPGIEEPEARPTPAASDRDAKGRNSDDEPPPFGSAPRNGAGESPGAALRAGTPGSDERADPSDDLRSLPEGARTAALTNAVLGSASDPVKDARRGETMRGLPRIAIVLDDCGQRLDLLERGVRIRQPLTFAVIPHLPHSRASAEAAHAAGHEVIVHQPMEPEGDDANPGTGVLRRGMSSGEARRILGASLAEVPHARGLNNHMGSKATADARLMGIVLGALGELSRSRPLYFLDSRTSADTVASEAARRAGLRTAERDVFLDNDLSPAAIQGQLDRLLAEAVAQGQAIGIGHLKPETLAILETEMPRLDGQQARFVFLGDLVR